jgi:glycosyltransferase involved in cell wall biosynthesis
MRTLVISHGHPTFSIGGAEVASHNLFKGLNTLPGHEAHYLARVGPPVAPHHGTPFMALRQAPRETLFWANDYDWFLLGNRDLEQLELHFARYLADLRPDVVHFHHILGFGAQAIAAVRKALGGVPIVVTLHEYLSICHHHGQMIKARTGALCHRSSPAECAVCFPEIGPAAFMRRELFLKSFFEQVDAFVSPSRFLIERYAHWGLPRERLHMLENGLDIGAIAPPRTLPREGGRRNRFAFFGQLNPFKGIKVLMEAVTRIPPEIWGQDAVLQIFGGNLEVQPPAFQDEVRKLIQAAGRRVRFMGPYKSADLPQLMGEVDWVVVPSTWWENAPVVIQEAFLHGRPIITSDIGGMAEKVRDRVDGLQFRAGSAESLVDRMVEAIRDPELWTRLRGRIRRPPSAAEAAEQHAALYQRLLRPQRAARRPASRRVAAAAV